MKNITILGASALVSIILLLYSAISLRNPLDTTYNNTIVKIMSVHGFDNQEDVFRHYPEMKNAEVHLNRIKSLRKDIRTLLHNPIPLDKHQIEHLKNRKRELERQPIIWKQSLERIKEKS